MKTRILIYGDSNTWGSDADGFRYISEKQWPNILQKMLGSNYEIIQEGLSGRIAGDHDTQHPHRNGKISYEVALRSAAPFDYLIVALGTNDVKFRYKLSPLQIRNDLLWYEERTAIYDDSDKDMENRYKSILYLSIANLKDEGTFSMDTAQKIREMMEETGLHVVYVNDLEHSDDGVHYSEDDHKKVAKRFYDKIKGIEK